jgi:hypothetical protein
MRKRTRFAPPVQRHADDEVRRDPLSTCRHVDALRKAPAPHSTSCLQCCKHTHQTLAELPLAGAPEACGRLKQTFCDDSSCTSPASLGAERRPHFLCSRNTSDDQQA